MYGLLQVTYNIISTYCSKGLHKNDLSSASNFYAPITIVRELKCGVFNGTQENISMSPIPVNLAICSVISRKKRYG